MSTIFISYVEEDAKYAVAIAEGLEPAGYKTWYYQRDSLPMVSYIQQEMEAMDRARAVAVILSPDSLKSNQVHIEVMHAHQMARSFIPVLVNLSWTDMKKARADWAAAMAASVGIAATLETLPQIFPRMIKGLKAMGIEPEEVQDDFGSYPTPLAAIRARRMMRVVEREQAFQFHAGLRELAETALLYPAAVLISEFRARMQDPASLEKVLAPLEKPVFGSWVAAARAAAAGPGPANDPLVNGLRGFFSDKIHGSDAVAEAAVKLQEWTGPGPSRVSPFSYDDFFDLLTRYRTHARGWNTPGAVLSPEEYEARGRLLAAALNRAYADLRFLADFQLTAAAPAGDPRGPALLAMGLELAPSTASIATAQPPVRGHVYLCFPSAEGRLEARFDLHPLLAARKCPLCEKTMIFVLGAGDKDIPVWNSPGCGHRDELTAEERAALREFISGRSAARTAEESPYLAAAREVLAAGTISAEDRLKLDFLAKMLKIQAADAAAMEEQVRQDRIQSFRQAIRTVIASREPTAEDKAALAAEAVRRGFSAEEAVRLEDEIRNELIPVFQKAVRAVLTRNPEPGPEERERLNAQARELGLTPERASLLESLVRRDLGWTPPGGGAGKTAASAEGYFERAWHEKTPSPVRRTVIFNRQALVLGADDEGVVSVWNEEGRRSYQERVQGRPYQAVAAGPLAVVSTWEGHLYGFGARETVWQVELGSPVSALAVTAGGDRIIAGTWSGTIGAFDRDGRLLWKQNLKDGISGLAAGTGAAAAATYDGHLAFVDASGSLRWLRQQSAPPCLMAFPPGDESLILVARDRLAAGLVLADQRLAWEKRVEFVPAAAAVSADGRRLILAGADGICRIFGLNGGLHLRAEYPLADPAGIHLPALTPDGRFMIVHSASGALSFADNRSREVRSQSGGAEGPVLGLASGADGRTFVVGRPGGLDFFRLARPRLRLTVRPQGELRKGVFVRVEIQVANIGQRPAQEIRVELSGPVECKPAGLPAELDPGRTAASVNQSMQAKAAGALPVTVKASFRDDLGLVYEDTEELVLDAAEERG